MSPLLLCFLLCIVYFTKNLIYVLSQNTLPFTVSANSGVCCLLQASLTTTLLFPMFPFHAFIYWWRIQVGNLGFFKIFFYTFEVRNKKENGSKSKSMVFITSICINAFTSNGTEECFSVHYSLSGSSERLEELWFGLSYYFSLLDSRQPIIYFLSIIIPIFTHNLGRQKPYKQTGETSIQKIITCMSWSFIYSLPVLSEPCDLCWWRLKRLLMWHKKETAFFWAFSR